MLQVVDTQIVQSFHLLTMHMLPGSPGDNMWNEVRVVQDQLGPQFVPEDNEDHETNGDLKEVSRICYSAFLNVCRSSDWNSRPRPPRLSRSSQRYLQPVR